MRVIRLELKQNSLITDLTIINKTIKTLEQKAVAAGFIPTGGEIVVQQDREASKVAITVMAERRGSDRTL